MLKTGCESAEINHVSALRPQKSNDDKTDGINLGLFSS